MPKEKITFQGEGIVYHGDRKMAEFKNSLLETDDQHIISTLRKRGYKEVEKQKIINKVDKKKTNGIVKEV